MWKTLLKLITKYYLQKPKCNIYWNYKGKDKRMEKGLRDIAKELARIAQRLEEIEELLNERH